MMPWMRGATLEDVELRNKRHSRADKDITLSD